MAIWQRHPPIPDYEPIRVLGQNGAIVYLARSTRLRKPAALQVWCKRALPPNVSRLVGQHHRNIVQVFDVGEVDGCSYLAFEYVEADTLAQRLRKGPLPDIEARACVAAIISALEFARDMGAVVANLTPGSVLLAEPLKLFLDPAGAIVTHPEFTAPEAASGDVTDVSAAADVYRVGALLYAMLTTKSPQLEVAQKRSQDAFADYTPVSPRQLNPAVSEKLEAICLKCLAPAPIDRYGSLREVAEALA